jgi:hypothetical protein
MCPPASDSVNPHGKSVDPARLPRPPSRFNVERDAVWKGHNLVFRRRVIASIEPDSEYPNMWRVRLPSGFVTDMVNRTRAKDAAICLAAERLTVGASPMRFQREAAE